MAWSIPFTAVANQTFTAADFNSSVRDNLLETAPALASAAGEYFISDGFNSLTTRTADSDSHSTPIESTTSTSFTDLSTAGPAVTVDTGTKAIVHIRAQCANSLDNTVTYTSFEVSGATTRGVNAVEGVWSNAMPANSYIHISTWQLVSDLTAGSNTFTMKYRVASGTGSYLQRHIAVIPL